MGTPAKDDELPDEAAPILGPSPPDPSARDQPASDQTSGEVKPGDRAPRAKATEIQDRINAFWRLLEEQSRTADPKVSSEKFVQATKDLGRPVKWSACRATLHDMRRKTKSRGYKLVVGDNEAWLDRASETVIERREQERPETKKNLGRLLWKVLFDVECDGPVDYVCDAWPTAVNRKLARLRSKSPVILIDAGSTTKAVIEALLQMESIPFEVKVAAREEGHHYTLIAPAIVTNSPPIAELISNSREHRREIKVTLVGGDYRPDHKAVCGTVTQVFLEKALHLLGDLAVVGATGYREEPFEDHASFCCDDLDESNLKTSFLRMAWFRVLVIDSRKLEHGELHSPFAPLSPTTVDLVILDDGAEVDLVEQVSRFREKARNAGVATAVLKTQPKKA